MPLATHGQGTPSVLPQGTRRLHSTRRRTRCEASAGATCCVAMLPQQSTLEACPRCADSDNRELHPSLFPCLAWCSGSRQWTQTEPRAVKTAHARMNRRVSSCGAEGRGAFPTMREANNTMVGAALEVGWRTWLGHRSNNHTVAVGGALAQQTDRKSALGTKGSRMSRCLLAQDHKVAPTYIVNRGTQLLEQRAQVP